MYQFETLIYYLSGVLSLFFSSTNTQGNSITTKRRCLITIYIALITFLSVVYIGQLATPLAIIGICILLTFRLEQKLSNLICFFLGYLLQVSLDYVYTTMMYLLLHLTIKELQQNYFFYFPSVIYPFYFFLLNSSGGFYTRN